ncbi:hypothetical protein [Arthrobacter sulfonylureivorans]|uniref:Uncharacterized protein n=1 Tax=Arthrobacter sulfonylureivorans TaxID=2486855 RepID=A0ABY3WCC2_9MICC|nr:hypothetical protein [Arthrobacter sulfonylureivorans]UNK47092.1 hypothetical protein MNQ99_07045 [Arthrobacter sulfonylureivorans]
MPLEYFEETDPSEIEYSSYISRLLKRVDNLSLTVEERVNAEPGSKLATDDARSPHYSVSSYGYSQILIALGCLESLGHMILREDEETVSVTAGPYGAYALVRNALDSAASALWLLEPLSSTLRVKRRIVLEVDEVKNGAALRQSLDRPWEKWRGRRFARMQEVANLAGLAEWDPLSKSERLPTMTAVLKSLERHHQNAVMPWLSAWQLASGHAHGKLWAQVVSHQLNEIAETRTESGATFKVSIQFAVLAALLLEAVQLIETACARYMELSSGSELGRGSREENLPH